MSNNSNVEFKPENMENIHGAYSVLHMSEDIKQNVSNTLQKATFFLYKLISQRIFLKNRNFWHLYVSLTIIRLLSNSYSVKSLKQPQQVKIFLILLILILKIKIFYGRHVLEYVQMDVHQ